MSCAGCPHPCGSCSEPTGGSPNSAHCSPDAKSGYTICPWPALTGSGCLPGGNCNQFGNKKFCLAWDSADTWKSGKATVDCTTTYGVVVDLQWVMTFTSSGGNISVAVNLYAYLTGTSTIVATIVTYTGTIATGSCGSAFHVNKSADGGQCGNWPCTITVVPLCCAECPTPGCNDPCCLSSTPGSPGPANAIVHYTSPGGNVTGCVDCGTVFDGTDEVLVRSTSGVTSRCNWTSLVILTWCFAGPRTGTLFSKGITLEYVDSGILAGNMRISFTSSFGVIFAIYLCPISSFSCDPGATNTFTQYADNGYCGPWPATITQSWSL